MNTRLDIERVLDHWLEDGPRAIPERVVDDALVVVARTDQIRRRRRILPSVGRHPSMQLALIAVLILLVAAVAVAAVAGFLRDRSVVVPLPSVVVPTPAWSSHAIPYRRRRPPSRDCRRRRWSAHRFRHARQGQTCS